MRVEKYTNLWPKRLVFLTNWPLVASLAILTGARLNLKTVLIYFSNTEYFYTIFIDLFLNKVHY